MTRIEFKSRSAFFQARLWPSLPGRDRSARAGVERPLPLAGGEPQVRFHVAVGIWEVPSGRPRSCRRVCVCRCRDV